MLVRSVFYSITLIFLLQAKLFAIEPNTVVATINVGVNPAGMAFTPDSKFAYVANSNNYGVTGEYTVSVLNLVNNTVKQTISDPSFNEPYAIAINSAGTKAYVANSNSSTVTIIDIATNTVSGVIGGFDGPSGIVINDQTNIAYVNNYGGPGGVGSGNGTTVSVLDLTTNTITGVLTVGLAPADLALSRDNRFVYVINYVDGNPGTGTMSVINTSDNSVLLNVTTGLSGPFAIAITPNDKYAYITDFGSNNFDPIGTTVSVVDLATYQIATTVETGIQPSGVDVTPNGRLAYVTNYNTLYAGSNFTKLTAGDGTVNIIDTITNKVIAPIILIGRSPHGIYIAPDGKFAYVSNYTSNTVTVIALPIFYNIFPSLIIDKYC